MVLVATDYVKCGISCKTLELERKDIAPPVSSYDEYNVAIAHLIEVFASVPSDFAHD